MQRLRANAGRVIASVLDLDVVDERAELFGQSIRVRGQVDRSTGLLMAGEEIHAPAAVVLAAGPDSPVAVGDRIITQRIKRSQDRHPRRWEWGGMDCLTVPIASACQCGALVPNDAIPARLLNGGGYEAVGARVIVSPVDAEPMSVELDVVAADTAAIRWGVVVSVGVDVDDLALGQVVGWRRFDGVGWTDAGDDFVSLRHRRRCDECGRRASVSEVLLIDDGAPGQTPDP